jgi:hypothetical protein
MNFKKVIQEYCPSLTGKADTSYMPEPKLLGADNTRRLMTQVYGMNLNGYGIIEITETVNDLWRVSLTSTDIENIIWSIDNEARLASMQTHL